MQPQSFLNELRPGQQATLVRVGGAAALRRRFAEMGFVPGAVIRVTRVAPFGDPVAYQIKGYHISLRREDAAQIEIRLDKERING